jgi:formylglycine-generating enzyme required for sulfatase activity
MASAGTTRWSSSVAPGDDQPWLIAAAAANEQKLLRSGSWIGDPGECRSACRSHDEAVIDHVDVGFRVVCLPQDPSFPNPLA